MASLDIKTFLAIAKAMTPAPIAPVLPLVPPDYNKGSEGAFGMAKDISYLTKTVDNIERKMDKISDTHVTVEAANNHILDDNKIHAEQKEILNDHEGRMRSIEKSVTRILMWGSAILTILTTIQVILKIMGK